MKKKIKKIVICASIFSSILLIGFGGVYFTFLHRYKGKKVVYNWSKEDAFDISTIKTLTKDKNRDFVILNLADVQLCDIGDYPKNFKTMKKEIYELVDRAKPDLITLTGDQTWSNENQLGIKSIVKWLDDLKIPYAPVFGNHDTGNKVDSAVFSKNKCCDVYEKGKYSLFSRGPTNIGEVGNYVLNIMQDEKVYKTIYMMDAGTGSVITDGQKEFFKWNADGIKANNNNVYSEGMVFMHKPLPEYYLAYYAYRNGLAEAIGDVEYHSSLAGTEQNGFFDLAKSCNVKDVVVGHQHWSNFTINYEDVRLTMAVKTGEAMSFYEDETKYLNGATVFKLSDDNIEITKLLVDRGKYRFS